MNQKVHGRKESLILREITLILEKELNNEILKNLSIAEVQLSKDSQLAKIYYSFLPINQDVNLENIENELDKYVKKIRMLLAHKLKSRTVPELKFVYDTSLDNANKIENILKEINHN